MIISQRKNSIEKFILYYWLFIITWSALYFIPVFLHRIAPNFNVLPDNEDTLSTNVKWGCCALFIFIPPLLSELVYSNLIEGRINLLRYVLFQGYIFIIYGIELFSLIVTSFTDSGEEKIYASYFPIYWELLIILYVALFILSIATVFLNHLKRKNDNIS